MAMFLKRDEFSEAIFFRLSAVVCPASVDPYGTDSQRREVGSGKACGRAELQRVEQWQVGIRAGYNPSTVFEVENRGGQRGAFSDDLLQRQNISQQFKEYWK